MDSLYCLSYDGVDNIIICSIMPATSENLRKGIEPEVWLIGSHLKRCLRQTCNRRFRDVKQLNILKCFRTELQD